MVARLLFGLVLVFICRSIVLYRNTFGMQSKFFKTAALEETIRLIIFIRIQIRCRFRYFVRSYLNNTFGLLLHSHPTVQSLRCGSKLYIYSPSCFHDVAVLVSSTQALKLRKIMRKVDRYLNSVVFFVKLIFASMIGC